MFRLSLVRFTKNTTEQFRNGLPLGGFLAGLIIPHENGFAISLVERLEDLVSILFMPIVCSSSSIERQILIYVARIVLHTLWFEDESWPLG